MITPPIHRASYLHEDNVNMSKLQTSRKCCNNFYSKLGGGTGKIGGREDEVGRAVVNFLVCLSTGAVQILAMKDRKGEDQR